jgi:tetratricopeptide (TPR) repeat protein
VKTAKEDQETRESEYNKNTNEPVNDKTQKSSPEEDRLRKKIKLAQLRSQIRKEEETALRDKIIIAGIAVAAFVIVSHLFYYYTFAQIDIDSNVSAALSLVAGFFSAFLIMTITGVLKEFSVKAGLIEFSSKLEKDIQNVETRVVKTKEEIASKIDNIELKIENRASALSGASSNSRQGVIVNVGEAKKFVEEIKIDDEQRTLREIKQEYGFNVNKPPVTDAAPSLQVLPPGVKQELVKLRERQEARNQVLTKLSQQEQPKIQKGNEDIESLIANADLMLIEGKYLKALKLYGRVLAEDDNNIEAIYKKGVVYYKMKRYDDSLQCFDEALELDPTDAYTWNSKGNVFYDAGKNDEALKAYDKALKLKPNFDNPWFNKGRIFSQSKNYEEAIKCYDNAITIEPNDADIWFSKGSALHDSGKYKEALNSYDKASEINPNDVDIWNNKGLVYHELKQYDKAIECYDKAYEIDPKSDMVLNNKAWTLAHLGKNEEAFTYVKRALDINSNDPVIIDTNGFILYNLGKYEDAIEFYDRAIALDSDNSEYQNHKKLALDKLRNGSVT